ncbi:ras association domain-containing protein 2-like [Diadema antillarum]|uniref:ras association domain-containing protein 2-like n=1 Tax=Diadema antillarum TaxID=105358 RepID=UPI003A86D389
MTEEGGNVLEDRYRELVSRQAFSSCLKQYNLYQSQTKSNQPLKIHEYKGMPVMYGILKLYWGTQRVIRLKKEEPTWKRRSIRLTCENGTEEKLMTAMGSGARNRRSLTKLGDSVSEIPEEESEGTDQQGEEGSNNVFHGQKDNNRGTDRLTASLPRRRLNRDHHVIGDMETREANSRGESEDGLQGPLTLAQKKNLRRRTMSFSGHMYNTKTRIFRPRYGTPSTIRVASTQSTEEVIQLLLNKFAVENPPEEFSLFSVSISGGTQELKVRDFPLIRRIQLGPDENIAKIFVMDRQTSQVSQEVAQYVNLSFPVLEAILRKYKEEEENAIMDIKKRYSVYQATLEKKLEAVMDVPTKKSRDKKKSWWK